MLIRAINSDYRFKGLLRVLKSSFYTGRIDVASWRPGIGLF